MILITDVGYGYPGGSALSAGVLIESWRSLSARSTHTLTISKVHPYVPGQFYRRELPCLLELLESIQKPINAIVIDGYAQIEGEACSLGEHLHHHTGITVIGVAKTPYKHGVALPVLRGESSKPLYVSAAGMDNLLAADRVQAMAGRHRLPKHIKQADMLSRGR